MTAPGERTAGGTLTRRTAVVSAMTMASRVLGLVRDIVIAQVFGARAAADAFFVAFRIPNLFRRWFGEGAFSQAFVPVLSEYRERHGDAAVHGLVAAVIGALGLVLALFTLLGIVGAPALISVFSPGFIGEPDQFSLAVELLRWTFPYLLMVSLVALSAGVLNTYGRFAVPAFTPVFLNVGIIGGALLAAPRLSEPVLALAYGVVAGGVLQLAFQVPALARLGFLMVPRLDFRHPGVRQIARLMGPAVFGASVTQFNLLIDTALASLLVTGSISWLYYADRMMEFPLGVFSIALGTVVLPSLSGAHQRADGEGFSSTIDWALRMVALLALPAAVGLALLAVPILSTLFEYGAMSAADVAAAARALAAYAPGLVALSVVKVLAPAYFARQDTRTPVKIGVVAVGVNIALNLAFIGPLKHVGLALATSLAAVVNAALLYRGLRSDASYVPDTGWRRLLIVAALALAAMAALLIWLTPPHAVWSARGIAGRAGHLLVLVGAGAGVYFASLALCGVRWRDVSRV